MYMYVYIYIYIQIDKIMYKICTFCCDSLNKCANRNGKWTTPQAWCGSALGPSGLLGLFAPCTWQGYGSIRSSAVCRWNDEIIQVEMTFYVIYGWLVVDLPLWKILVKWDDDIPNIWKNKKSVPNHQSVMVLLSIHVKPWGMNSVLWFSHGLTNVQFIPPDPNLGHLGTGQTWMLSHPKYAGFTETWFSHV